MNSEITNKTESNSENPFLTAQYRVSVFSDGSIKIEPIPFEAILQDKNNQPLTDGQRDLIGTVTVQPNITFRTADAKSTTPKQPQCSARIMQTLKVLSFAELFHTDYPKLDASIVLNRSVRRCANELNIAIASVNDKLGRQMKKQKDTDNDTDNDTNKVSMSILDWQEMLKKLFDADDPEDINRYRNDIYSLLMENISKSSAEEDIKAIDSFFENKFFTQKSVKP